MKKFFRIFLKTVIIAIIVILLGVLIAAGLFFFNKPLVKRLVENRLNAGSGLALSIGRLGYRLAPLEVRLEKVSLSMDTATLGVRADFEVLETKGDLRKLLRGDQPALDSVLVQKPEIEIVQKAVSAEPIDFESLILTAAGYLNHARLITVEPGSLIFSMPGLAAAVEQLGLRISRSGGENGYHVMVQAGRLQAGRDDGSFAYDGGLSVAGSVVLGSRTAAGLRLRLSGPVFKSGFRSEPLKFGFVSASVDAIWDTVTGKIDVSKYDLTLDDLAEAEGAASASFGGTSEIDTYVRLLIPSASAVLALAGDFVPAELRDANLDGRIAAVGRFSAAGEAKDFDFDITVDDGTLSKVYEGIPLSGSFGLSVEARGFPLDFQAEGRLEAAAPRLERRSFSVGESSAKIDFSASAAGAEIKKVVAHVSSLDYFFPGEKKVSLEKIGVSGRGRFDLRDKSVKIDGLQINAAGLPPVEVSGLGRLEGSPSGRVVVQSKGLEIPVLRGLAGPFIPGGYAGWDAGGVLDLKLEAERSPDRGQAWNIGVSLAGHGISFNDPDFRTAGDRLAPILRLDGSYAPGSESVPFSAGLELKSGECLFKNFYIAWDKHNLKAGASGSLLVSASRLEGLSIEAELPGIGDLGLSGTVFLKPEPGFSMAADFGFGLGPLFSLYSQSGASAESRMNISGDLAGRLKIGMTGRRVEASGVVRLGGAGLENPASDLSLGGISAEVPIDMSFGPGPAGEEAKSGEKKTGHVLIGEIAHPLLSLKQLKLELETEENSLAVRPLEIDLFGGRLELSRTAFGYDRSESVFRGRSALRISGLDLSKIPMPAGQVRLAGSANLDLPSLEISPERIEIEGDGRIEIFGGTVVMSGFSVTEPFNDRRRISLDVVLNEIDLKKLTDVVPFGEVTGIINGEIRDLSFSYGQPESFYFRIDSVRKKGVPQTFSLKAVDNLTILSSGEQASVGTGPFWMQFVKGFRYSKLGIVSTLKNDTFTLNGTIKEGGVEYLVKKPLFFGINVINRMPDKRISFKEMTDRLSRVGRSEGPSGNKGG